MDHDTIAALATAPGGSIAIIRVSGLDALSVAEKVWRGKTNLENNERRLVLGQMIDPETQEPGDQAMAVYMKGPQTYTGEDVVEFQCHGGNFTAKHTLMCALKAGARAAEAGEFTKRAYVNGKLDLTQAEAVMDVISAGSEKAMQIAVNQLNGRFGNEIRSMYDGLSDLFTVSPNSTTSTFLVCLVELVLTMVPPGDVKSSKLMEARLHTLALAISLR